MASIGCGCKICKANLGDLTNELIVLGESPKKVLADLQEQGLKADDKLLKRHLSAFNIKYPEETQTKKHYEPIRVDLNKIDFSKYNFDTNNLESIIGYLQKINLKILLNQQLITLQAQQDIIDGVSPDMPREIMQNLAIAWQLFEKSSGVNIHINQAEAIKVCVSLGLIKPETINLLENVEDKTNT